MERASSTALEGVREIMERASSTALQGPRDDIIVPLLHLFLCLAMSVMLFVEVYRAIIILVKLFRKRPERRYIWEPMHEKDEFLVQIPMYNKKEAMDRGNAVLQRKLEEVESGIGKLLEHPPSTYIHDDDDDDRKVSLYRTARKIDFIKNLLTAEMNSRSPHRQENLNRMAMRLSILQKAFVDWASPTSRFSKLDETFANGVESADNNGAVDKCPDTSASGSCTKSCVNEDEKIGEKKEAEMVSQRKAKVNEDEKVGEKKQEAETVQERKIVAKKDGQERDGNRKEKTVGEVGESKDEVIGEKKLRRQRKEKGEMTKARERNREAELVGFQKAEVNRDDERRKRKCHGVRSCMAMGCAAIAGFTSALILVALANIPYVEETVYLVPT